MSSPDLEKLARELTVSTDALRSLGVTRNGTAWLIPERDASGEVIGRAKRYDDGGKGFVAGGHRGLTYANPLDNYAGSSMSEPVFVVEGMSDVAAGLSMGLDVVGRPSATGGADQLAKLLRDRHVCIIAENDGAGRKGAQSIAEKMLDEARSVRIVSPPPEHKDLRTWYSAVGGADKTGVLLAAAEAAEFKPPTKQGATSSNDKRSTPSLIRLSDVEPTTVRWLWPGRIPRGRMTLLVGRPGGGKSFATADFAARVSTGRDWPDGTPCTAGSVLLCSAEDDPADTIAPRLIAHDADRSRIHLLTGVRFSRDDGSESERVFTLHDLDPLRQALETLDDCRLILVDPIGSYLGGQADAHRDNEVRGVLAPLCKIAEEHDAALLVVSHTRKSAAAHADDTAMGSRAFTGLARSVLHLMADPDDDTQRRRLLLPGKNNLAERPAGLAFDIGPGVFTDDDDQPRPCVRWHDGTVDITADDAVNREPITQSQSTERDEAAEWLQQALAAGARPAKDIIEEAQQVKTISKRTLDRAKKAIGVDAYRIKNPGPWWWRLPDHEHNAIAPQGEEGGNLAMCSDEPETGPLGGES